jgi:hypothetical protein
VLEVAVLFLIWWQNMSSVIFANTTRFRLSDPFALGLEASSRLTFAIIPFLFIPFLAACAFPMISRRISAGFLAVLFVPMFCLGAFASSFSLIPLETTILLAVLTAFVYRTSQRSLLKNRQVSW